MKMMMFPKFSMSKKAHHQQQRLQMKQGSLSSIGEEEDDTTEKACCDDESPVVVRRVRFPEERVSLVATRRISRLSTRALSEIAAMWGDEDEEEQRKAQLRKDLDKVAVLGSTYRGEDDNDLDDGFNGNDSSSELCTLGLEDKVGDRAEEKHLHREKAWDAVMWEQHYQWEEQKSCDYDVIAKVYSEGAHTSEVQKKAQEEAKQLEQEVLKLRNSDPEVLELLKRSCSLSMSDRSSSTASTSSMRSCLSSSQRSSSINSNMSMSSSSSSSSSFSHF